MNDRARKLQALRNMTVENGCTEQEAATAARLAEKLEAQGDVDYSDDDLFDFDDVLTDVGEFLRRMKDFEDTAAAASVDLGSLVNVMNRTFADAVAVNRKWTG